MSEHSSAGDDPAPHEQPEASPETVEASDTDLANRSSEQVNALVAAGEEGDFLEVTSRRLSGEITGDTYRLLLKAGIIGQEGLSFLTWLGQMDPSDRKTAIDKRTALSADAARFVRHFVGVYGEDLGYAWDLSQVDRAQDWLAVGYNVYRDVSTGDYRISLRIRKRNRETAIVDASATSILRLIRNILEIVLEVDDPKGVARRDAELFFERVDTLRSMVDADESAEPSERHELE